MNKVALYSGNNSFAVSEVEPAKPDKNEVKVKIAYCGICGTDLHIFHGKMDQRVAMPQVIGHEMSGTVMELGVEVKDFKVGERVVVRPLDWCGECPACEAGHQHICMNLKFMGIDSPGAMQDEWIVKSRTLHKFPDTMEFKLGALIEPLAVACHDVKMGQVKSTDYVVVLGGGPIGMLVAMVAQATGAEVLISEINSSRLTLAANAGFNTINPLENDIVEFVNEKTNGAGADVLFEVTASQAGATVMTELVKPRGRIVAVGIFSEPPKIDMFKFFWRELTLCGARVYEQQDFDDAIELAASGKLPLDSIISGVYQLDEIQSAFESFENNNTAMKVLIKCN
jgi:(R,R)-butanediol dehydrogenase / meso-butanediol dehydrogenase / diacetyl reductase